MSEQIDFRHLMSLLLKPADAPAVAELIRSAPVPLQQLENHSFVEFKDEGVSLMLKEISPPGTKAQRLCVYAFHFHRDGHEGYSAYPGQMPGGVAFGDSEKEVERRLGAPAARGGGGMSVMLKKPIPRWIRYFIESTTVQFQLDSKGRVEMVTIYSSEASPERR